MKNNNLLFILLFCFSVQIIYSITNDNSVTLYDYNSEIQEKVYLHFDKTNYELGDDIWFKIYLLNAENNKPESLSKIVYVDLIDQNKNIINSRIVSIENGCGFGDFKLENNLKPGEFTIRAYTNFMRNFDNSYFFRKKIVINTANTQLQISNKISSTNNFRPNLNFFPESGTIIGGYVNRIGFKATNHNSKGIDISGEVIDDDSGAKISKFETSKFGLGMIQFIPEYGRNYSVDILYLGIKYNYKLPEIAKNGVIIQLYDLKDHFKLHLISTLPEGVNNLQFKAIQNSEVASQAILKSDRNKVMINIPKEDLLQGHIEFAIFNEEGAVLSKRYSYNDIKIPESPIALNYSKNVFSKEEEVILNLSSNESTNLNLNANLSISVLKSNNKETSHDQLNIVSYLLLNSDFSEPIENSDYYLRSSEPQRKKLLDLLMLTTERRNLNILQDSMLTFYPELNFSIEGTIKKYFNQSKATKANVFLTYKNSDEIVFSNMKTDDNGRFKFNNLNFKDSTSVIIQAKRIRTKDSDKLKLPPNSYRIELDSFKSPAITISTVKLEKNDFQISDADFDIPVDDDFLDEVVLKSVFSKKRKEYNKKRMLYKNSTHTLDFKEEYINPSGNALSSLQGRIPGLRYDTSNGVVLRGANSIGRSTGALVILDGMPLGNTKEQYEDIIMSIPVSDIHFVDVLVGGQAAIFGSRGANGVVAIYTKNGSEKDENIEVDTKKGILNFIHPGYSKPRKFENIPADSKDDHKEETVYWNPDVYVNGQETTSISFKAPKTPSTYKAIVEGITKEGIPIFTEFYFEVK